MKMQFKIISIGLIFLILSSFIINQEEEINFNIKSEEIEKKTIELENKKVFEIQHSREIQGINDQTIIFAQTDFKKKMFDASADISIGKTNRDYDDDDDDDYYDDDDDDDDDDDYDDDDDDDDDYDDDDDDDDDYDDDDD